MKYIYILSAVATLFYLTSCNRTYTCACEVEYQTGDTGMEFYPIKERKGKAERMCKRGRVGDNVKYQRNDCELRY